MEAQDYKKLVKALRCKRDDCEGCDLSFFDKDEGWMCRYAAKDDDAAAAIEGLQAKVKFYKNLAEEWQGTEDRKERLLGMYRAQNIYSAKDSSGNFITNLCSLNRSESPNSPENPDS